MLSASATQKSQKHKTLESQKISKANAHHSNPESNDSDSQRPAEKTAM
jgi:hypothetical protein